MTNRHKILLKLLHNVIESKYCTIKLKIEEAEKNKKTNVTFIQ